MPKPQNKEKILKAGREKCQVTYKGKHIRITPDLSAKNLKARRLQSNISQALRKSNCQLKILYPAKLSFDLEGEMRTYMTRTC
jgi:hypothetical protein